MSDCARCAELESKLAAVQAENETAHTLAMTWHHHWLLMKDDPFDKDAWVKEYIRVFELADENVSLKRKLAAHDLEVRRKARAEALEEAALLDPWEEHLARNPIASVLSTPRQCMEVKNALIRALIAQEPPETEEK